jgi:hypothetical protein
MSSRDSAGRVAFVFDGLFEGVPHPVGFDFGHRYDPAYPECEA